MAFGNSFRIKKIKMEFERNTSPPIYRTNKSIKKQHAKIANKTKPDPRNNKL